MTGLPFGTEAEALTVFNPAVVPRVQVVRVATPPELVLIVAGLAGLVEPPPAVTVNTTLTPATGFPLASVTTTEGGALTVVPAAAL